jgi:hypothetical protein
LEGRLEDVGDVGEKYIIKKVSKLQLQLAICLPQKRDFNIQVSVQYPPRNGSPSNRSLGTN